MKFVSDLRQVGGFLYQQNWGVHREFRAKCTRTDVIKVENDVIKVGSLFQNYL